MRLDRLFASLLVATSLVAAVGVWVKGPRGGEDRKADSSADLGKLVASTTGSPEIGVIDVYGVITDEQTVDSPFSSAGAQAMRLVKAIRKAEDDGVKGLLLRINSPGGSAAASQAIYMELMRVTRAHKLPIAVSMGDVTASGGYFIAAAARRIFALPSTTTGSIGVIMHAQDVSGLMNKLGVHATTIQSGANKDIGSPYRPMRPDERALLQAMCEDIYQQFLEAIVAGRGMPLAKLRPLADGRVYTGRQALRNGLVDELGTSQDAIRWLKKTAHLGEDPQVKNYTESSFLDQVLPGMSTRFGPDPWSAGLEALLRRDRVPLALME